MKRVLVLAIFFPLLAGCAAGKTKPTTTAAGKGTPATESAPSAEAAESTRRQAEAIARVKGGATMSDEGALAGPAATTIVDKATGKRLERIPKSRSYFVRDGVLYNQNVFGGTSGDPLIREDAEAYYIEAAPEPDLTKAEPEKPSDLKQFVELPASEAEVVSPPRSARRLRLEENSTGLPKAGFWRTNMAVADLDGDGRLEIVAPPPRLTISGPRVFGWTGTAWEEKTLNYYDVEPGRFSYGGVAVGDMNGDGKPDIVMIGHGSGICLLLNEGFPNFRMVPVRLPAAGIATGRALALGDFNGDGRLDIVAQSDETTRFTQTGELSLEVPEGGRDVRLFLQKPDGDFEEAPGGPEWGCYGYAVAASAPASDGREPFFYSSCRYYGGMRVLHTFDKTAAKFTWPGKGIVEELSYHIGGTAMTYMGKPGVAATYMKVGPDEGKPNVTGYGITIYYRDGEQWKSQRVFKTLVQPAVETHGIAAGDLDGDGLDDLVWADDGKGKLRVFFQKPDGGFEELDEAAEPAIVNRTTSVRVADVDGDGRKDVVLMYEYSSSGRSRSGGLRFFRNVR